MIASILPTYARAPLNFVKGEGTWLIEADGRRFLDLGAGIAVNALGHAHPDLVDALSEQAQNLWHVSNLYEIPNQQRLADRLVSLTFADTVFFTNSGTESCELAVKMARKYWYDKRQPERVEIITFEGSFQIRPRRGSPWSPFLNAWASTRPSGRTKPCSTMVCRSRAAWSTA